MKINKICIKIPFQIPYKSFKVCYGGECTVFSKRLNKKNADWYGENI